MDFDFNHIAVPFRMQPGLRRMACGEAHLTPLAPDGPLYQEKLKVVEAGQCFHGLQGFETGPALEAIARQAEREGHAARLASVDDLPLAFEEDFAVLDGNTGKLAWLCVCTPSHWAPEDKLGLDFAAVHAPVADNAALLAASSQLVRLATGGGPWERFVWTVSPSGRYDQHPSRQARTAWPAGENSAGFAAGCFFRAERQTLLPVEGAPSQAVFTIRVMLQPLTQAISSAGDAHRLRNALASMSDATLAYKNLTTARAPLLHWLNNTYP
ncbi:MAG: heme-dependent oxidative N-demethylase subunit alpha family protein [Pseudomonadota bacterium]